MEHLEMDLCFHIDQLGVGESFGKGFSTPLRKSSENPSELFN